MASGNYEVTMIIGTDLYGDWIILKAPDDENFLTILDGNNCEENGFTNSFPKLNGVYEVKCRVHWDDGRNAFFEPTDPDLEIEIIEHKLLVLL